MKKNIIIALLMFLLFITVSYIVYYKFFNKKEHKVNEKKTITVQESIQEPINNSDTNMKIDENRDIQIFMFGNTNRFEAYGTTIVDKTGSVYLNVFDGSSSSDTVKKSIANLNNQYQDYDIDGYQQIAKNNGEVRVFNGIKLPISNVVVAYELITGQSYQGWSIYFLKTDGTISRFSLGKTIYENDGNIILNDNIDNLTNIVSLSQSSSSTGYSDAHVVIAIEKDGTQHIIQEQ